MIRISRFNKHRFIFKKGIRSHDLVLSLHICYIISIWKLKYNSMFYRKTYSFHYKNVWFSSYCAIYSASFNIDPMSYCKLVYFTRADWFKADPLPKSCLVWQDLNDETLTSPLLVPHYDDETCHSKCSMSNCVYVYCIHHCQNCKKSLLLIPQNVCSLGTNPHSPFNMCRNVLWNRHYTCKYN